MKTNKQQELVDSFLDTLDHELGSLYREIVMCLSELGYYPRKQRSYLSALFPIDCCDRI